MKAMLFHTANLKLKWSTIVDGCTTFETNVFAYRRRLLLVVTNGTQCTACILEEALVGEHIGAEFTLEAMWMPIVVHRLDYAT